MARDPSRGGKPQQPKGDELLWLETYFIVFPHERRPTLTQVEHALAEADPRLKLENLAADDDGLFASLLVQSPEDHAAVEISYEIGEAVIEQNLEWAKQLQKQLSPKQLQLMIAADARLDVAHFERVQTGGASSPAGKPQPPRLHEAEDLDDDEPADDFGDDNYGDDDFDAEASLEIFDPTCLLTVVETLSKLTRGIAFDPAAGEVV
jgi:hypothetical protein